MLSIHTSSIVTQSIPLAPFPLALSIRPFHSPVPLARSTRPFHSPFHSPFPDPQPPESAFTSGERTPRARTSRQSLPSPVASTISDSLSTALSDRYRISRELG